MPERRCEVAADCADGPVLAFAALSVSGCASTIALDRAVLAYDLTTAGSVAMQLLLNIAARSRNPPMHFTAINP